MAAALNAHGKLTTPDGTVYDKVQVIVRANTLMVRQGSSLVVEKTGVQAVTQDNGSRQVRHVQFADGSSWTFERLKRGCGCR